MKTLLVSTLLAATPAAHAASDFMKDVDSTITSASLSEGRLTSERYYRLMARLSVYALYCDFENKLGYSLTFHKLWNRTDSLQVEAEKRFGGFKPAYNKFESIRNQESLRYVKTGAAYCQPSYASFVKYTKMSGKEMRSVLEDTKRGDL